MPVDYECPCVDQYILQRFLLNSGIEKMWALARWSDVTGVAPDSNAFVSAYVRDMDYFVRRGRGLFFHGAHGNGKSLLSALVAKKAIRAGFDVFYIRFNDLLDRYTDGWSSTKEKHWFEATVRNAELLVIDDIGKEYAARMDMVRPAIDAIFRARVQGCLATIITTNEGREEFQTRYGKAVSELITESCRTHEFTGPGWREESLHARQDQEHALRLTRPFTFG